MSKQGRQGELMSNNYSGVKHSSLVYYNLQPAASYLARPMHGPIAISISDENVSQMHDNM